MGERERLLDTAREAAEKAYAPYSGFRVGAAVEVQTVDGPRVVTGANVENASFGLTLCAERAALAAAMQLGTVGASSATTNDQRTRASATGKPNRRVPEVTRVAIACIDAPADAGDAARMPCGACRQWLAELAPHATYYVAGVARDLRLADVLPDAFVMPPEPAP